MARSILRSVPTILVYSFLFLIADSIVVRSAAAQQNLGHTSFSAGATLLAPPGCTIVEEKRPPFYIVQSLIQSTFNAGAGISPDGYYPKGTVVRVNPEDLGRLPLTRTTSPVALYPRVKVLSVPKTPNRVAEASAKGKRATIGTDGYINSLDLVRLNSFGAPSSDIFQVNSDSALIIAPELRGKPIRLAFDGENYLTKRCGCSGNASANENLRAGKKFQFEYDRHPKCTYSPVFEVLQAYDPGHNQLPGFKVERFITAPDCDAFMANLTPVERQNQRMLLQIRDAIVNTGSALLSKLTGIANDESTEKRCLNRTARGICTSWTKEGNFSKGMCRQAVRETLQGMGLWPDKNNGPSNPRASASLLSDWLGKNTPLKKAPAGKFTAETAPVPSVLVYGGEPDGHVETKIAPNRYCSDYCTDHPRNRGVANRPLMAVYEFPVGK